MQLMKYRKHASLSLSLAFAAMVITPSAHAFFLCDREDIEKVVGTTVLFTALTCFIRLVTKKTQPKRVYPKDDSFSEIGWYVFDELLTGQMEKGERPSKVIIDDLSNPQELTIQYSKVEARGVAGILYSTMKPVIIPALTFMVLINKDFLQKAAVGIHNMTDFINKPTKIFDEFMKTASTGNLP
jgi:hypothetical protein